MNKDLTKPLVLTVAGSDPSGGAGIQADIRAFESTGVYGLSVITAITVQTAAEIIRWEPVDTQLVRDQLFSLLETYPIGVVKTGMLPNPEILDLIAEAKQKYGFTLVVDPILKSGTGKEMGGGGMKEAYISKLFPITDIITPNALEAGIFTGIELKSMQDVPPIGDKFAGWGVKAMILKGGHQETGDAQVIDYLYYEGGMEYFARNRVSGATVTHGTGCIFSALFTANLAITQDIYTALHTTENQIDTAFRNLFRIPTLENKNSQAGVVLDVGITPEQSAVLHEVSEVYQFIRTRPLFARLVAEVRMNVSFCTPNATEISDVGAIEGRITTIGGLPYAAGPIKMGVSNHTARLVLTAHKKDPTIRSVVNLRYNPEYIKILADEGMYLFQINRERQEDKKENQTMQWVIHESYQALNRIPDIIWDCGEPEKEPMLRLFAGDSASMIEKLKIIHRALSNSINQELISQIP